MSYCSVDYTRFSDQVIFIDEQSQTFMVSDLSSVTLPDDYVNKLSQLNNSKRRTQNGGPVFEAYPSLLEDDSLCELHRYSFNHLKFLFRATKTWLVLLWMASIAVLSLVDHLPRTFKNPKLILLINSYAPLFCFAMFFFSLKASADMSVIDFFWCAWLGRDGVVEHDIHRHAFTGALACFIILSSRL